MLTEGDFTMKKPRYTDSQVMTI